MRRLCALVLLLGLVSVTAPAAPVAACTPTLPPRTPFPTLTAQQIEMQNRQDIQATFSGASVVFRGRVATAAAYNRNNQAVQRAEVVPLEIWKGQSSPSFVLYNDYGSDQSTAFTCIAPFYLVPNMEYLVYAFDRGDGTLSISARTRLITAAADDLNVLGPGMPLAAGGVTPVPSSASPSTPVMGNVGVVPPATAAQVVSPQTGTSRTPMTFLGLIVLATFAGVLLVVGFVIRSRAARPRM